MKKIKKISLLSLFLILISCSYYKINNPPVNTQALKKEQTANKYLIVHKGDSVWHFKNVSILESKNAVSGQLEQLPAEFRKHLRPKKKSYNYYDESEHNATIEVHIYVRDIASDGDVVQIPMSMIDKIDVYDRDVEANTASIVMGVLGSMLIVTAFVGIAALATKSSCPFVYVRDSNNLVFAGEIYSGAIYPAIERDDYLQLPDGFSKNCEPELIISNELKEIQHTNVAELIHVEHPTSTKVLLDQKGNIQLISKAELPFFAKDDNNVSFLKNIEKKDNLLFLFNSSGEKEPDESSLELRFKKNMDAKSGKLILTARNSFWLDYTYGKFNELFGSYYNTFASQQKKVPASELKQWSEQQHLPLQVSLWVNNEWKTIEYLPVVGPLSQRDIVVPIDISAVNEDIIKVKLNCGFMFWELDYASMDFSENTNCTVGIEVPTLAEDKAGRDISEALRKDDSNYHIQPNIGNKAFLKFQQKLPKEGNCITSFLHSRGYYEYIRDYKGIPNVLKLNEFKKEGALSRYSKELLKGIEENPQVVYSAYNNN